MRSSWRQASWPEIFLRVNSRSHSPYVTSSLRRGCVCLSWICLAFLQVYVSYIWHLTDNYSFCSIHKFPLSPGSKKQIMFISGILCYNGSLVTWTVISLTAAKFKPLIFPISGFALCYIANIYILMILYDICLLPAQVSYIIVYILKVESSVQIVDRRVPWKIVNCADWNKLKVKVKVTLRLAVYRQSVCLGIKPLETHDQKFFPNWTLQY
jgi:hypothetical protein